MSGHQIDKAPAHLFDPATGDVVGMMDRNGRERHIAVFDTAAQAAAAKSLVAGYGIYDNPPVGASFIIPTVSTSAVSIPANQYYSAALQMGLADAFYAAAPVFTNYDTTQSYTITAKVGPTSASLANLNTNTYTALTFSGASSVLLPAATMGAGGQVIPSVVVADFVSCLSLAAVGGVYLLDVVETVASTAGARTINMHGQWSAMGTLNSDSRNPGFISAGVYNNNADWVTTTPSATPVVATVPASCVGVLTLTAQSRWLGLVCGDSRDVGQAGAANYTGWPLLTNWARNNVSLLNLANGGQKTVDSVATMKAAVAAFKPAFVTLAAWSPNDGSTQAVADSVWSELMRAAEWLRQRGVTLVLRTPIPSSSNAAVQSNYARCMALKQSRYLRVVDMTTPLHDGSFNLLPAYDSGDHVHMSDAGYSAAAAAFSAAITAF